MKKIGVLYTPDGMLFICGTSMEKALEKLSTFPEGTVEKGHAIVIYYEDVPVERVGVPVYRVKVDTP